LLKRGLVQKRRYFEGKSQEVGDKPPFGMIVKVVSRTSNASKAGNTTRKRNTKAYMGLHDNYWENKLGLKRRVSIPPTR